MKTLHPISLSQLRNLEFGQLLKSSIDNIEAIGVITDASSLAFINAIKAQNINYDLAMVNIAKSDETAKIVVADKERDNVLTAFLRQLSVHEFAETDAEINAYVSLKNLMNAYSGIQKMNYEQETNAIDNLLNDLNTVPYSEHILTLGMDSLVARIIVKATTFKTLFQGRTLETASQESYDVKSMRKEMSVTYQNFSNYILSMATLQPASQANTILNLLNALRKYYHDLLAIRQGKANDETPIPPML